MSSTVGFLRRETSNICFSVLRLEESKFQWKQFHHRTDKTHSSIDQLQHQTPLPTSPPLLSSPSPLLLSSPPHLSSSSALPLFSSLTLIQPSSPFLALIYLSAASLSPLERRESLHSLCFPASLLLLLPPFCSCTCFLSLTLASSVSFVQMCLVAAAAT